VFTFLAWRVGSFHGQSKTHNHLDSRLDRIHRLACAASDAARAILIWRKANEVYCRRLDNAENTALRLVERGTTLGEVCEAVADLIEGDTVTQLNQMLQRWLCDAVLAKPCTR